MMQKLLAVVLAVVGANWILYGHGFPMEGSLGFFCFIAIGSICTHLAFFSRTQSKQRSLSIVVSGLAILSALLSVFRASTFDSFWLSVQAFVLSALALYLLALTQKEFGSVVEIIAVPFRLFTSWIDAAGYLVQHELGTVIKTGTSKFTKAPSDSVLHQDTVAAVVRGVAITIPVLFVIVSLLAQADPIFSRTIENLFKLPSISVSIPGRLLFSMIVAALVAPVAFLKIKGVYHSPLMRPEFKKFRLEFSMLSAAIAAVLAVFLIIQFRYLFLAVPDQSLQSFGMATYSDYVRKGFGELTVVAFLVYGIVAASLVVYRQQAAKAVLLKRINMVLLAEMGIFILSILRRVMLYQAEHGLTRVRVYGTFFLLMLVALTVVLLLRYLKTSKRPWYLFEAGIVVLAVLFSSFLNVDKMIATLWRPTVNNEVDYMYITRLSADAVDGWVQAVWQIQQQPTNKWLQQTTFSNEEARLIVYSYRTLTELVDTYGNLAWDYGTSEEQAIFHPDFTRDTHILRYNVAKASAYRRLLHEIPPTQMQTVVSMYRQLYSQLSKEQQNMLYDRSYDSPLTQ